MSLCGCVHVCAGAYGGQRRQSDLLDLESRAVGSHWTCAHGTELQPSASTASVPNARALSPVPLLSFKCETDIETLGLARNGYVIFYF